MCGLNSRANSVDIARLRADARRCFARAGIHHRYVDTAVVMCLTAAKTRPLVSPLNYCLAVGRRLQDESTAEAVERWREFQRRVANTCPHGSNVEACPDCAKDRARALGAFPQPPPLSPVSRRAGKQRA
jgi:hypothetical protein